MVNKRTSIIVVALIALVCVTLKFSVFRENAATVVLTDHPKILLVWDGSKDDKALVKSLQTAFKNLQLSSQTVNLQKLKQPTRPVVDGIIKNFNPEFIIAINENTKYYKFICNYVILTKDSNNYLRYKSSGDLEFERIPLEMFEGFFPTQTKIEDLQRAYSKEDKPFVGFQWTSEISATAQEQSIAKLIALHFSADRISTLYKEIKPISDSNLYKRQPKFAKLLKTQQLPEYFGLVAVSDKHTSYYLSDSSYFAMYRMAMLIQKCNELKQSGRPIPPGEYLISFHDGIHQNFAVPMLAYASDKQLAIQNKAILLPDISAMNGYNTVFASIDKAKVSRPWALKKSQVFWRGSATGLDFQTDKNKSFPRLAFMEYATHKDFISAGFTTYPNRYPRKLLKFLKQNYPEVHQVVKADALNYKYLLDIDGHSCSYSRMAWILYSNSLLLKHSSNKVQWYYTKLEKYKHYIPVAADFSDLQKQMLWASQHPGQVQKIIENANNLAAEIFEPENVNNAIYAAFLKYHDLHPDLQALGQHASA